MIKYTYIRDRKKGSKRVLTIARDLIDDGDGKTLLVGFALCSPRDHFRKAMGRTVSSGRMMKNPVVRRLLGPDERPSKVALDLISEGLGDLIRIASMPLPPQGDRLFADDTFDRDTIGVARLVKRIVDDEIASRSVTTLTVSLSDTNSNASVS